MGKKVYICKECGGSHYPTLPLKCKYCGRELKFENKELLEMYEL